MKKQKIAVIAAIVVSTILYTAITWWKLRTGGYNGLDLGIYNHIFWNTVHGNAFGMTIHPQSYLGDHVEPFLLALTPLYALAPSPRTLLFLQSLALALAAYPLFLITSFLAAKKERQRTVTTAIPSEDSRSRGAICRSEARGSRNWSERSERNSGGIPCRARNKWREAKALSGDAGVTNTRLPLFVALFWLANPLVHNIALFEFHIVAFIPVVFFFLFLAYLRRDRWLFLVFAALLLSIREDAALLLIAFGVFAFIDTLRSGTGDNFSLRRMSEPGRVLRAPWWWGRTRPVSGEAGEASLRSEKNSSTGTPTRFFAEFTLSELRRSGRSEPNGFRMTRRGNEWWIITPLAMSAIWLFLVSRIIHANAIGGAYKFGAYVSGTAATTLLSNLFQVQNLNLLLALGIPFLFFWLGKPNRLLLLAFMPILPFLALGAYDPRLLAEMHYVAFFLPGLMLATIVVLRNPTPRLPQRLAVILLAVTSVYTLITMSPLPHAAFREQTKSEEHAFLADIPMDAAVATTATFLTELSSRKKVYLLDYAIKGTTQFGAAPYTLPTDTKYILLNTDDLREYKGNASPSFLESLIDFSIQEQNELNALLCRGCSGSKFLFALDQKPRLIPTLARDRSILLLPE